MPNTDGLKLVLSENLRRYMGQKGIKTADLSRALGYSFTTVSDWVNGRKYPRMDKVQAIADYFGIMKSDLTEEYQEQYDTEQKLEYDDFTYAMQAEMKELTETDKQLLLSMAKQLNDARRQRNGESE